MKYFEDSVTQLDLLTFKCVSYLGRCFLFSRIIQNQLLFFLYPVYRSVTTPVSLHKAMCWTKEETHPSNNLNWRCHCFQLNNLTAFYQDFIGASFDDSVWRPATTPSSTPAPSSAASQQQHSEGEFSSFLKDISSEIYWTCYKWQVTPFTGWNYLLLHTGIFSLRDSSTRDLVEMFW